MRYNDGRKKNMPKQRWGIFKSDGTPIIIRVQMTDGRLEDMQYYISRELAEQVIVDFLTPEDVENYGINIMEITES